MYISFWKLVVEKQENKKEFLRLLTEEVVAALKNEPGIIRFDVLDGPPDSNICYAYEVYKDSVAHDFHMQQPYLKEFVVKTKGWYKTLPAVEGFRNFTNAFPQDSNYTPQQR